MTIHTPQIIYRNSGLHAVDLRERERLSWELDVARQVQARLFPNEQPFYPGLEFFGTWRAAHGVSGDYLDYLELAGGNLGVAIGDVAGKGVSAALLMSALHSMVRTLGISRYSSLSELASAINRHFLRVSPESSFASLFLARYDHGLRKLHYLNAGHEPPFVLRKVGNVTSSIDLPAGGPVVGMFRDAVYRDDSIQLALGDLVVAYTDGISELTSPTGEEWGKTRLVDAVTAYGDLPVREIVKRVLSDMTAFAAGEPQHDDMTLWIARVGDAEASKPLEEAEEIAAHAVAFAA